MIRIAIKSNGTVSFSKEDNKEPKNPFRGQEQHNNQGLGTDLFIRKNLPGSTVGRGYTIDIWENGVKVDTVVERNKERVIELVKKYKQFYHTDRAFQNEQQVHVTYKKRKKEESELEGRVSMDLLERSLYKKADILYDLIQKATNPYDSIKKRALDEDIPLPVDNPSPTDAINDNVDVPSYEEVLSKTLQKVVDYFSRNIESPKDSLYNTVKKWLADLRTVVEGWNDSLSFAQASNADEKFIKTAEESKIDLETLAMDLNSVATSGNPDTYKQYGIDNVTQETATAIKDIFDMSIGEKDLHEEAAEGGDTTAQQDGVATPPSTEPTKMSSLAENILSELRRQPDNSPMDKALEERIQENKDDLTQEVNSIVIDKGNALTEEEKKLKTFLDERATNAYVSSFWKYAKTNNLSGDLDKIFLRWASEYCSDVIAIASVWNKVCTDIDSLKEAEYTDSYGTIEIYIAGIKKLLFRGNIIAIQNPGSIGLAMRVEEGADLNSIGINEIGNYFKNVSFQDKAEIPQFLNTFLNELLNTLMINYMYSGTGKDAKIELVVTLRDAPGGNVIKSARYLYVRDEQGNITGPMDITEQAVQDFNRRFRR